jgi:hypothetical protein
MAAANYLAKDMSGGYNFLVKNAKMVSSFNMEGK